MASSFEITIYQGHTTDHVFDLLDVDGIGTSVPSNDTVYFRIFRGDGQTTILLIAENSASANGSTLDVNESSDPPTATVRFAEDDIAAIAAGAYRAELYLQDDSETAPADAKKIFSIGIVYVVGGAKSTATQPKQIVDIADVIAYLGKGSTLSDKQLGLIAMIKPKAEAAIRKHLGISITQRTHTHFLPTAHPLIDLASRNRDQGRFLRLPETPVRSITSIHVDRYGYAGQEANAFAEDDAWTAGEDYYLDLDQSGISFSGIVVSPNLQWPSEPGSIKVVYVAGWTEEELRGEVDDPRLDASDIALATLTTIAEAFQRTRQSQSVLGVGTGELKKESLGDYSVEYSTMEVNSKTENIIISIPKEARDYLRPYKKIAVG